MSELDERLINTDLDGPANPDAVFEALQEEKQASTAFTTPQAPADIASQIPEKFRGKSFEDVVKAYTELEKISGRNGQELGELRKLTDEYISTRSAPPPQISTSNKIDIDALSEPEKIKMYLEQELHPVKAELVTLKQERMDASLRKNHPDFENILKSADFQKWVLESDIRKEMFVRADNHFDIGAANELFSTWKMKSGISAGAAHAEAEQAAQQTAFTAGRMETGRVEAEVQKKIYRRADIIALKMRNPERYAQLEPEIRQAYAENRVR